MLHVIIVLHNFVCVTRLSKDMHRFEWSEPQARFAHFEVRYRPFIATRLFYIILLTILFDIVNYLFYLLVRLIFYFYFHSLKPAMIIHLTGHVE